MNKKLGFKLLILVLVTIKKPLSSTQNNMCSQQRRPCFSMVLDPALMLKII